MPYSHQAIQWLLEDNNPAVRYLAIRDLVELSEDDKELKKAKSDAYTKGEIGIVLRKMKRDGYWVKPGPGYNPKYYSTVWSLILLSQLGASFNDDIRIMKACGYYLDQALSKDGSISYNKTPSGTIDCLAGNMCLALMNLGFQDERLDQAIDWMAKSVVGKVDRYYAYKCGPKFACGANGKLPCAWGATKVLLALGKVPSKKMTAVIHEAIDAGVKFFLEIDPVTVEYPTLNNIKPNRGWWKFGFPVFYITDILQIAEALVLVGYGKDKRLKNTIEYIKNKQNEHGRWLLEYDYPGKTWGNYGKKNSPNKWVTYRALKLLKSLE